MGIFGKSDKSDKERKEEKQLYISSNFGKVETTIENARERFWYPPKQADPRDFIDISKGSFYGIYHIKDEKQIKPVRVPFESENHILFCGITRSGKGVQASVKCYEALQKKGRGIIYIDVKTEEFTPQVIKEELEEQNRGEDLKIVSWSNNFCYTGFNKDDTVTEIWEKICVGLGIERAIDEKVEHYRRTERMTLLKLLKVNQDYKRKYFNINWVDLMNFCEKLQEDLKKRKKKQEEQDKAKVNQDKIEELENTYFDEEFYKKLNFDSDNIKSLGTIYIKLYELLMSATVYDKYTVDEALYNGKVLYIRADMENQASLQFIKVLLKDISQRVRKRKRLENKLADCLVVADEVSFYAEKNLAGSLSTMAGFGVQFLLQLQDLGQIEDKGLKSSILTNCSVKLFFKISDEETLKYVETLGGQTSVKKEGYKGSTEQITNFETESSLNPTVVRAMWYKLNAILIAEYYNTTTMIDTSFIPVKNSFDWESIDSYKPDIKQQKFILKQDEEIINEIYKSDSTTIEEF